MFGTAFEPLSPASSALLNAYNALSSNLLASSINGCAAAGRLPPGSPWGLLTGPPRSAELLAASWPPCPAHGLARSAQTYALRFFVRPFCAHLTPSPPLGSLLPPTPG